MNGRVYDPFLARMISPDPTVPGAFNSQAFNRYSYVLNNPLAFTDPSGFDPIYFGPVPFDPEIAVGTAGGLLGIGLGLQYFMIAGGFYLEASVAYMGGDAVVGGLLIRQAAAPAIEGSLATLGGAMALEEIDDQVSAQLSGANQPIGTEDMFSQAFQLGLALASRSLSQVEVRLLDMLSDFLDGVASLSGADMIDEYLAQHSAPPEISEPNLPVPPSGRRARHNIPTMPRLRPYSAIAGLHGSLCGIDSDTALWLSERQYEQSISSTPAPVPQICGPDTKPCGGK